MSFPFRFPRIPLHTPISLWLLLVPAVFGLGVPSVTKLLPRRDPELPLVLRSVFANAGCAMAPAFSVLSLDTLQDHGFIERKYERIT